MSPARAQPKPLSICDYFEAVRRTDRFSHEPKALQQLRFGFFGEIGGLLASVKKSNRDDLHETETAAASEELGDALWYLAASAALLGIDPNDLGNACIDCLRVGFGEKQLTSIPLVTFRNVDGVLDTHRGASDAERNQMLGELAHASGVLAQEDSAQLEMQAAPSKGEHFGRLLANLSRTCGAFSLRIEDVARENLEKIASRWPGENPKYIQLLDEEPTLPPYEKLPRSFSMLFEERGTREKGHVVQSLEGVFVGDRLTDNSHVPDDYRFHDVFHLAYVAHLGWSPVIRALLKRKRKSNPQKDENEDGARAMVIEEGIATWIFNHAKKRDFYAAVELGRLEYGLLKQIRSMVSGYEVEKCPLWQWERAILDGFAIFRQLKIARRGMVEVNMSSHTICFKQI